MRLRQYYNLTHSDAYSSHAKCYVLTHGSPMIHEDLIHVLTSRLAKMYVKHKATVNKVEYRLADIKEHMDLLFYEGHENLFIIDWEDGVLDAKKIKAMFLKIKEQTRRRCWVFINPSGSLKEVVRAEVPSKKNPGTKTVFMTRLQAKVIECDSTGELFEAIRMRLTPYGVDLNEETAKEFTALPFMSLFNIFKILEFAGKPNVSVKELESFDLLRGSLEYRVATQLIDKGREVVMRRYDLMELRPVSFFACVLNYLRVFSRFLGVDPRLKQGERMQKTEFTDKNKFEYYEKKFKKFDASSLWKRLFTVVRYMRWERQPYAHLLLLHYW